MKQRWEIMRFLAAEQRQRRRKRMIFVCVMAVLAYCVVLFHWTQQPQSVPDSPKPSSIRPLVPSSITPTPSSIVQSSINRPIVNQSSNRQSIVQSSIVQLSIPLASSATPHVLGPASSASSTTTLTSSSARHSSNTTAPSSIRPFAITSSLARSFVASTEQTAMRKAGRRSGFVDDPDPQTPGDPLATDPFADDPDPLNPADPLNPSDPLDTPIGDSLWPLLLLLVLYCLKRLKSGNYAAF